MPDMSRVWSLNACVLCVSLLVNGCASTPSIDFSRSDLKKIPLSSLQRMASAHAADEVVAVRVSGSDRPAEVKAFESRDHVTVYADDGKEEDVKFSDISALLIFRKPKPLEQAEPKKGSSASGAAAAAGEALAYAPIVPLAVGTWPLLRAMGLDASKNSKDNAKARLVYLGMSRKELMESVGEPREKYSCILKLHLKDRQDVPQEIWVYDDDKVLRGGRSLSIDSGTGTVSHNSFHTSYFKDSDSFRCTPLLVPR